MSHPPLFTTISSYLFVFFALLSFFQATWFPPTQKLFVVCMEEYKWTSGLPSLGINSYSRLRHMGVQF